MDCHFQRQNDGKERSSLAKGLQFIAFIPATVRGFGSIVKLPCSTLVQKAASTDSLGDRQMNVRREVAKVHLFHVVIRQNGMEIDDKGRFSIIEKSFQHLSGGR